MRIENINNASINGVNHANYVTKTKEVHNTKPVETKQDVNSDSIELEHGLGYKPAPKNESTINGYGFNNSIKNALRNKIHNRCNDNSDTNIRNCTNNNTTGKDKIPGSTNHNTNDTTNNNTKPSDNNNTTNNTININSNNRITNFFNNVNIFQVHLDRYQPVRYHAPRRYYLNELFRQTIQKSLIDTLLK